MLRVATRPKRLPQLGPSLQPCQRFKISLHIITPICDFTLPPALSYTSTFPSRFCTVLYRILIMPVCYGPLHALAGNFPFSSQHSRDSFRCPNLRLHINFRMSIDHHVRTRTPVQVTLLPQPGAALWYPPLQNESPSSRHQ
jgi:hypothetical protein